MISIRTDTSQLDGLVRDFEQASEDVLDEAEKVVSKGSLNIKNDARRRVSGFAHLPQYPSSISYDTRRGANQVESEIGPDKDRSQGPLGTIIENGSVNNAPIPHLSPALDAEEPRFVSTAEDIGEKLL